MSLQADPSSYYPYFCGYVAERGEGEGSNLNLPLPFGTGDDAYIAALVASVRLQDDLTFEDEDELVLVRVSVTIR